MTEKIPENNYGVWVSKPRDPEKFDNNCRIIWQVYSRDVYINYPGSAWHKKAGLFCFLRAIFNRLRRGYKVKTKIYFRNPTTK